MIQGGQLALESEDRGCDKIYLRPVNALSLRITLTARVCKAAWTTQSWCDMHTIAQHITDAPQLAAHHVCTGHGR